MKNLLVSLAAVAAVLALIYWALPAKAQTLLQERYGVDVLTMPNPIYRPPVTGTVPYRNLYQPMDRSELSPIVPLEVSPNAIMDGAAQWNRTMRQWRLDQQLADEQFHRLRQRQRQAAEDSHLNALRVCAHYNRGCFNELGGR